MALGMRRSRKRHAAKSAAVCLGAGALRLAQISIASAADKTKKQASGAPLGQSLVERARDDLQLSASCVVFLAWSRVLRSGLLLFLVFVVCADSQASRPLLVIPLCLSLQVLPCLVSMLCFLPLWPHGENRLGRLGLERTVIASSWTIFRAAGVPS